VTPAKTSIESWSAD